MAKPSSSSLPESPQTDVMSPTAEISEDISPESHRRTLHGLDSVGVSADLPDHGHAKHFFSVVIADVLKPLTVGPGRLTYLLTVKRSIINSYAMVHGGAVASIANAVSTACARTVVRDDIKMFLGEQSISYLAAATENAEMIVDAKVVRRGRNVTVVAVDFRLKKPPKLACQSRSTFFNMPLSKL